MSKFKKYALTKIKKAKGKRQKKKLSRKKFLERKQKRMNKQEFHRLSMANTAKRFSRMVLSKTKDLGPQLIETGIQGVHFYLEPIWYGPTVYGEVKKTIKKAKNISHNHPSKWKYGELPNATNTLRPVVKELSRQGLSKAGIPLFVGSKLVDYGLNKKSKSKSNNKKKTKK
mgnify:CR=1 FL=1